jgi:hypothetical protein
MSFTPSLHRASTSLLVTDVDVRCKSSSLRDLRSTAVRASSRMIVLQQHRKRKHWYTLLQGKVFSQLRLRRRTQIPPGSQPVILAHFCLFCHFPFVPQITLELSSKKCCAVCLRLLAVWHASCPLVKSTEFTLLQAGPFVLYPLLPLVYFCHSQLDFFSCSIRLIVEPRYSSPSSTSSSSGYRMTSPSFLGLETWWLRPEVTVTGYGTTQGQSHGKSRMSQGW